MTAAQDARFMALALMLGQRGMGRVWPNPAVGCVIVKDGVIVGRGYTADGGRPHAEPRALAQAGNAARGATAYVTLEPCAHHGQTPPCAAALIAAGIARCVIATTDPDSRVSGKGVAMLQEAGITVDMGVGEAEANRDHAGFFNRIKQNRPWLTLKLATTLDGRIATRTGDSKWITGPNARRAVHAMRARHDAVMVGGGTARADDPMLDVRDMGDVPQPVRVVVSQSLNLPQNSKLARTANDQPLWLCHGADAPQGNWPQIGATLLSCATNGQGLNPASVLEALAAKGLTRVFCEGGGAWAASLLRAGLVDEMIVFGGGAVVGADGTASVGDMGFDRLQDAPRFVLSEVTQISGDIYHRWHPA
ncbi:bifunctional diaminohydroxyphosphoribosylaminopyrimidine deaminase/5-amino-6-(5-phosphoribosylamino)uracil reductase RibD [Yoonia sp. R2331]|uniref:bifunctional diaminohydroxyphosphoribosylaminopyrimidine deaminase/5-amino-6-(5-phosphoribosylamino)uracil reductase RibD n=1 Tax=Yoonia sp. R2331 TaxID=3237238 RepID=UPI0034E3BDE4